MTALVIGATGAVGKDLVDLLLKDDSFESVSVFVRRPLGFQNPRLTVHLVDFDLPGQWHHLLTGDVLFSCLGTTIKAAGSQEAQWKVDYTYQFPACYILQPPSLIRKGSDRFGEKAGVAVLKAFNAIGLMRSYKPMPTEEVAAAMVRLVKSGRPGTETIVSQDILKA